MIALDYHKHSVAVAEPSAAVIADEVGLHPRVVIAPVMMIDGGV
jgi:hypothetical protein